MNSQARAAFLSSHVHETFRTVFLSPLSYYPLLLFAVLFSDSSALLLLFTADKRFIDFIVVAILRVFSFFSSSAMIIRGMRSKNEKFA
jgi:hypothetical protein